MTAQATDRRQRRRAETIEEILDVAAAIMFEQGAGGLSLGEVARRMGIRPPSLYTYFDSKNALYDALFARGWNDLGAVMTAKHGIEAPASVGEFVAGVSTFVRWAVEHPAYAQLMFWRPVPGYQPSPDAYTAAIGSMQRVRAAIETLRAGGALRPDADVDEAVDALTALTSGVISQQLANAPDEAFDGGTFTRRLPQLLCMYLAHYGTDGGER